MISTFSIQYIIIDWCPVFRVFFLAGDEEAVHDVRAMLPRGAVRCFYLLNMVTLVMPGSELRSSGSKSSDLSIATFPLVDFLK